MSDHVILCGLPCSGKTTVGRRLAEELGRPFIDLDDWVDARSGSSCRAFFFAHGEAVFRQLEQEAVANLPKRGCSIVATGGGALMSDETAHLLKMSGQLIYIQVESDCLLSRLDGGEAFLDCDDVAASFASLYAVRHPRWLKYADIVVDATDLDVEALTTAIIERIV